MNFPSFPSIRQRASLRTLLFSLAFLYKNSLCAQGTVEVGFFSKESGDPISARIEFTEPLNRPPKPQGSLVAGRQILVERVAKLSPPIGKYEFIVRRGIEFSDVRTGFELEPNAKNAFEVYVPHKTSMRDFRWYSGDLLSLMPVDLTSRWMKADDLDLVATTASTRPLNNSSTRKAGTEGASFSSDLVTPSPQKAGAKGEEGLDRVQASSIRLDRLGQAGLLIHRSGVVAPKVPTIESFIEASARDAVHIEVTKPWERDVPLLLATDQIDSVQLLSEHLLPDSGDPITNAIRNPDKLRFKGKKALGRLGEYLYWQMLEAGLRLPPTAGSGFDGKASTHLGYNRVYVFIPEAQEPSEETWWSQLKSGHTIVTNGPLLRTTINDLPPGSVFTGQPSIPINLNIALELTVRDRVEYLDVIFNGSALYQARLEDHSQRGEFPELSIDRSGWLVLRVVTEHENSYRLATTAPFYFDFDNQPRVSRAAVQFFADWLEESTLLIENDNSIQSDPTVKATYKELADKARHFWSDQAKKATAE
jgi:hypothetical protein